MISPVRRSLLLPVGLVLLASSATSGFSSTALASSGAHTGSVAAIINGHQIPLSTYKLFLKVALHSAQSQTARAAAVQQTKQEIIYNELIREYAAAHHITTSAAELNAQEQQDERSSGGLKGFEQRLKAFGLTLAEYHQLVGPNVLDSKVEQAIAPTKTTAQALALARKLLAELQHGANFAALAKKYSDDTGSALQGGDLGTVYQHQMVPPFDFASFHDPIGKYEIVHSQYGYHIVQVLSRGKSYPQGQTSGAKVETAHVRHILISTQPGRANQTKFLAWLQLQQKHSHIKWRI